MKSFLPFLMICTLTMGSGRVWAKGISVDELLQTVLAQNSETEISKTQIEQADARVGNATARFLPKISVNAIETRQADSGGASPVTGSFPSGLDTRDQSGTTAQASASMNIFNGFQDRERLRQREKEREGATSRSTDTSFQQGEKAIVSIYRILSLQQDIENLEEKIRIEKDRMKDVERRVASRSVKVADLVAVQSSIAGSQGELLGYESDLHAEWSSLSAIAGRKLIPEKIFRPATELQRIDQDVKVDRLPAIKAAKLELEAAEHSFRSAKGGLLPAIDLSYNRYLTRPEQQRTPRWTAQITLSLALPIDGDRFSSIREARSAAAEKELSFRQAAYRSQNENEELLREYNLGLDRLGVLNEAVELQGRVVEAYKRDYQAGLVSISDYLSSIANFIQKRQTRDRLQIQQLQRNHQIRHRLSASGEFL